MDGLAGGGDPSDWLDGWTHRTPHMTTTTNTCTQAGRQAGRQASQRGNHAPVPPGMAAVMPTTVRSSAAISQSELAKMVVSEGGAPGLFVFQKWGLGCGCGYEKGLIDGPITHRQVQQTNKTQQKRTLGAALELPPRGDVKLGHAVVLVRGRLRRRVPVPLLRLPSSAVGSVW